MTKASLSDIRRRYGPRVAALFEDLEPEIEDAKAARAEARAVALRARAIRLRLEADSWVCQTAALQTTAAPAVELAWSQTQSETMMDRPFTGVHPVNAVERVNARATDVTRQPWSSAILVAATIITAALAIIAIMFAEVANADGSGAGLPEPTWWYPTP